MRLDHITSRRLLRQMPKRTTMLRWSSRSQRPKASCARRGSSRTRQASKQKTNRIGGAGSRRQRRLPRVSTSLPGGNSEREPPDPIPNSEVKTLCADGSVAASHARVGHCQASSANPSPGNRRGVLRFWASRISRPRWRATLHSRISGPMRSTEPFEFLENARAARRAVCRCHRRTAGVSLGW